MSTLVRADGIILRTVKHGETSLIVTVFTREQGKVGLMAKGARGRNKSGAAVLTILAEAQFVYYQKSGRDLQLLKEWVLINPHSELRSDLTTLSFGSAAAELLGRCLRDDDPHEDAFREAQAVLNFLDRKPKSPLPLFWSFEIKLLGALGFELRFRHCAKSGLPLTPPFRGAIRYRLDNGSFEHPDIAPAPGADGELSPDSFAILAKLVEATPDVAARIHLSPRSRDELDHFLTRYLETHLPVRGRLKSLDALHWNDTTS